jgi:hypothetical protein
VVRTRLDILPGNLAEQIAQATDEQKRAICLAACKVAVQRTGASEQLVEAALRSLEKGRYEDASVTAGLKQLVDDLDAKYFEAQELYEAGKGTKEAYLALFRKARAANAVLFAFNNDPFMAACESFYEAGAAADVIDDALALLRDEH